VSDARRPWWLFVSKSTGLVTTVRTESSLAEQHFIIRGEPLVQGLAWLTWGPVAALLAITVLTGLAIILNIREQSPLLRGLFIILFLGLPVLAWAAATMLTNHLSKGYLEAERAAGARECHIRVRPGETELFFQTSSSPQEERLLYAQIQQVKAAPIIGGRDGNQATRLMLDTSYGPIVLLDETLGTQAQKADLARELQQLLAAKDAPPKHPGGG
jgi:hypothetical protein